MPLPSSAHPTCAAVATLAGLILIGCTPTGPDEFLEHDTDLDSLSAAGAAVNDDLQQFEELDTSTTGEGEATSTGHEVEAGPLELTDSRAQTESGTRLIPVRFIVTLACAACDGPADSDEATLRASLDRANESLEPAGIKLWVKSIERISMLQFYNSNATSNGALVPWSAVEDDLRRAFPRIPANAYFAADAKKLHAWMNIGATLYGDRDSISIFVQAGSAPSSASFPEKGSMVRVSATSLVGPDAVTGQEEVTSLLGHELGHLFGIQHPFAPLAGTNPASKIPWGYADEWDLLWCETAAGPLFWSSRDDYLATPCYGTLRRIDRDADYCGAPTAFAEFRCTIQGQTFFPGAPEISGIAEDRGWHQPPMAYGAAVNATGYFGEWDELPFSTPVFHSASAKRKIALYSTFSANYSPQVLDGWRKGNQSLPSGTVLADYKSPLPELGTSDDDFTWFGNGDFSFESRSLPTSSAPQSVAAGDFNGDGIDDAVIYAGGSSLTIRWGLPDRTFVSSAHGVPGTGFTLLAGDFDGDGRSDLFLYRPGTLSDHWMFGESNKSFTFQLSGVSGSYTPFVGNFDGSAGDDIGWYYPAGGTANFWYSTGVRAQVTGANWVSVGTNARLASGDFDGDGRDDILVHGPGTSSDQLMHGMATPGAFARRTLTNVNGTYEPIAGDFDGDGFDDVLWEATGSTYDYIWPGRFRRAGTFGPSRRTSSYGFFATAVGDFDGDGVDDVFWHHE